MARKSSTLFRCLSPNCRKTATCLASPATARLAKKFVYSIVASSFAKSRSASVWYRSLSSSGSFNPSIVSQNCTMSERCRRSMNSIQYESEEGFCRICCSGRIASLSAPLSWIDAYSDLSGLQRCRWLAYLAIGSAQPNDPLVDILPCGVQALQIRF